MKEKLCDYCEKNTATKTMQSRTICREIKDGKLISNEPNEPPKYWCDECWNKYE